MRWEYDIADMPSNVDEQDLPCEEWLRELLSNGYEPFAVTDNGHGTNRIHLRRMVLAEVNR